MKKNEARMNQSSGVRIDWADKVATLDGMTEGEPMRYIANDTDLSEADFVQRLRVAVHKYFGESLKEAGLRFRIMCSGKNSAEISLRRK